MPERTPAPNPAGLTRAGSPALRKPPLSIAIIAALFLAVACLDFYRGLAPLFQAGRLHGDDITVLGIAVAALVGGIFLLRGHDWARWLLTAWMGLHVAVSIDHVWPLIVHTLVFALLLFFFFRPRATAFFRPPGGA